MNSRKAKQIFYNSFDYLLPCFLILMFSGFAALAISFIYFSLNKEGWLQNLLLGLGTGFIASALVSLVFFINDLLLKQRDKNRARCLFMEDFKSFYYVTIHTIDFDLTADGKYSFQDFVKIQHRWFHEYYKKMVASNTTKKRYNNKKKSITKLY